LPENGFLSAVENEEVQTKAPTAGTTLRDVTDQANTAMDEGRFSDAIPLWEKAREIAVKDDFIVQQLALATYKSKQPDPELALLKAKEILKYLQPSGSFDTETLGIWASVHKRLYEISKDADDLDEAIFGLERGFFIRQDHYTGINFAYLLDVKASLSSDPGESAELHAVAGYVRRKVVDLCKNALASGDFNDEQKYWVMATLYEAAFGLGKTEDAEKWKTEAFNLPVSDWMFQSTEEQIGRLRELLAG
jgi:tetratricopeptide (TPR) repeat protein